MRVRHPRIYTEPQEESYAQLSQSATWQDKADEYDEYDEYEIENDQAVLPVVPQQYSPFLPSSLAIDELDTVPPEEARLHHEIAPARLTDYGASALSGPCNLQFPLDLSRSAVGQKEQADLQFPLEMDGPFQLQGTGLRFPLEIDEEPARKNINLGFPLEIDEEPIQKSITPGFPLEIGVVPQKGNVHISGGESSFPVVWPDVAGESGSSNDSVQDEIIEHPHLWMVKERQPDISELETNPPPAPRQPRSMLALHNEPFSVDDIVAANTVMDDTLIVMPPAKAPDIALYETRVEDIVDVALTARARQLLHYKGSAENVPAFAHSPLDYLRWWLLYPGRLEFLFWLGGALLLGIVMCIVLVMTGLGLGFMSFGHMSH